MTDMRILTVNMGSSSLKLRLLAGDDAILERADVPTTSDGFDAARLGELLAEWETPDAIAHRIVHGGVEFRDPTLVNATVRRHLADLAGLAPLHQPKTLAALDAVTAAMPNVPAVACFDTAFHATIPPSAAIYPLPRAWRDKYHLRRYGFHGLSNAYVTRRSAELLARPAADLRIVVCHLGAGASVTAVAGGHSVDTSMGFTPLDGLIMATRSGGLDPGLILWLQQWAGISASELAETLERRSGLLALAGSADMRSIEMAALRGDETACLALEAYAHRLVSFIAAMVAAMGGIDALVFTGGVGENSPGVRRLSADRLAFLGLSVDPENNARGSGDRVISARPASVRVLVVECREDLQMAKEARELLAARSRLPQS